MNKIWLILAFTSITNCAYAKPDANAFAKTIQTKVCGKDLKDLIDTADLSPISIESTDTQNTMILINGNSDWILIAQGQKKDGSDTCVVMGGTDFSPVDPSGGSDDSQSSPPSDPMPDNSVGGESGSNKQI